MAGRDEAIAEKEKRILELKHSTQARRLAWLGCNERCRATGRLGRQEACCTGWLSATAAQPALAKQQQHRSKPAGAMTACALGGMCVQSCLAMQHGISFQKSKEK